MRWCSPSGTRCSTTFVAAKADQEVIRRELADRILKGQERIIRSDPAAGGGAHLVELPQDDLESSIRSRHRSRCVLLRGRG
jgi:hypothetical protein